MKRRNFLNNLPLLSAIPLLNHPSLLPDIKPLLSTLSDYSLDDPKDDAFWNKIRESFNLSSEFLDLNSAGLCQVTSDVFNAYVKQVQELYPLPSRNQTHRKRESLSILTNLAELTNCKVSELVLQRNATEALSAAIFGIPLSKGDEVIVGSFDYPHMYYAWIQRAKRDGIILKYVDVGKSTLTPKKIIKNYLKKVTPRTRAIFVTDLINYTGCQVPTKEIFKQLPEHVRYRIVDAAQSFANSRNDFKDFGATHVGTSLHKWLGTPAAAGLLYVKEEFISETWPLFASKDPRESSIQKFAHIGTSNVAIYDPILLATEFYKTIGYKAKYERLIELSDYFVKRAKKIKGFNIVSPRHKKLKSNIVVFKLDDIKAGRLRRKLWDDHNIYSVAFDWKGVSGLRISPNVFTRKSDLDLLLTVLGDIVL